MPATMRGITENKTTAATRPRMKGAGSELPHLENRNVEPSAQFSDGDASDRLFRGDPGAGAKSRGRQKPRPDFCGHLQCLPQEPTGSVEDRAARVPARLPAPALHDQR